MLAITGSSHAEQSLLRLLLDNLMYSAAALYDENLLIICAGGELLPSFNLGAKIEGQHISEIFAPTQTELLTHWFTSALYSQPLSMNWPSGDKLLNITVRRVHHESTQVMGVVLVQDLTALTSDENIALQKNWQSAIFTREVELVQTKARMIERILHEFRNPLAAAASSADILETYGEGISPEKRYQHVSRINQELHRLSAILDDILNLVS